MSVSRKSFLVSAAVLPAGALLAACSGSATRGSGDGASSSGSAESAETITVEHAFGTTEVPTGVTRVATIQWANQDVPLALGVMPVGFTEQTWGVEDGSGMLPWTKQKVGELVAEGAKEPTLFTESDDLDMAAIEKTQPEVILAAYSGIDEDQYNQLSEIAPTVAFPTAAWSTPWRELITMNATAIGRQSEGEALVTQLEETIEAEVAKHPQLAGKTAAFFYQNEQNSSIGFYTTADPRAAFLTDLGMEVPESVRQVSEGSEEFSYDLSAENADQVSDVDVIVMYGEDSDLEELQSDPLVGTIPAVRNGAVALIGADGPLAASANPGPLSIPWGITEYVTRIADAADAADTADKAQ
ncbi:iron-siderophore ABC transporter substrate-binding protein [Actinomyces wuliandei]|uniref:iron-siderophore ABC transporter substrate-binding protein n=1 Tax=Actinomyces wuliandei TaxID=2057743 RepID=UPI000FD8719C|nr:iron-siderophore ABC transporter substrate-binding protein [Actinomyces wuliandei]